MNGEWYQFLYNDSGNKIDEYELIFKKFNLNNLLLAIDLIEQRIGQKLPKDREKRIKLLDSLEDDEFYKKISVLFDKDIEKIWDIMEDYIIEHEKDLI